MAGKCDSSPHLRQDPISEVEHWKIISLSASDAWKMQCSAPPQARALLYSISLANDLIPWFRMACLEIWMVSSICRQWRAFRMPSTLLPVYTWYPYRHTRNGFLVVILTLFKFILLCLRPGPEIVVAISTMLGSLRNLSSSPTLASVFKASASSCRSPLHYKLQITHYTHWMLPLQGCRWPHVLCRRIMSSITRLMVTMHDCYYVGHIQYVW